MRLLLLLAFIIAALAPDPGAAASRVRSRHRPPTHCPELRMEGFCFYDSGWRPAADNPLFSPLRPGDPHARIGPACEISDSHGRALASYETERPELVLTLRIGGRLVRFRPAPDGGLSTFISAAGRLTIREGRIVAAAHESDAHRATLTFTDRRGRSYRASVRIDCWV